MALIKLLLALVLAALLETFGRGVLGEMWWIDPFLILVILIARRTSPATSIFIGSAAGLIHDALSGGLFGLHGFADTLTAWAASRLEQRLVMQQTVQIGWLFALAAALQQALLVSLAFLLVSSAELPGVLETLGKMLSTGLLGAFLVATIGRLRGWESHWRAERGRRLRLDVKP